MDWENLYCQNVHTTQRNTQIRRNPYQNTISIFHRTGKNHPKIHMEAQKTPKSQSNLGKEQNWRYHAP